MPLAYLLICVGIIRSTKDAAAASDSDPASASEMMPDEAAAPVSSKRKPGTSGKKQAPAAKEFDPFEEDADDVEGDTNTTTKRRRHGASVFYPLLPPTDMNPLRRNLCELN